MAVGRDVPLVPERGRWVPVRGSHLLQDTDPLGPDERACADLARPLGGATIGGLIVFQVGLVTTLTALGSATNAPQNALRGIGGNQDLLVPTDGSLLTTGVWLGLALTGLALVGMPSCWFARVWLLRLAHTGGWHGWTLARAVDPEGTLSDEARWRAILQREAATGGARPESVVRWVRALAAPPDPALRPWVSGLREHLKDGEAQAQQATASAPGGVAEVPFAGRSYEASELAGLCRTGLEHVREVLVRMP
jgi:hypothetical protein